MILAIFDVDKTIFKGDSLMCFGRFLAAKGRLQMAGVPRFCASLIGRGLGRIDSTVLKAGFVKMFCRGMPADLVRSTVDEFTEAILLRRLYPQAIERIRWHERAGHELVLLSASLDIYLERLAAALNMDTLICTRLAWKHDLLTGDIEGLNCKAQEKQKRLLSAYGQKAVSWDRSYAYADSISDLPILAAVGNPVVVNPDRRLRRVAQRNDWSIEKWD